MKSVQRPPRLARRLFAWYCGNAQVDDLVGDMDEIFERNLSRMAIWRARLKYWSQVLSLMSSYAIKRRRQRASFHPHSNNSINFHMIRNYFVIAGRMMSRNIAYTIINVLGLTLGISACLIVFLVVSHEFSFDRFHPDKERIYRIQTKVGDGVNTWYCGCVAPPTYSTLRDEYAGADAVTGYFDFDANAAIVANGEEKNFDRNTVQASFTEPGYFKIFQYAWLAGNPDVLAKPHQVVLTENRAHDYFGSLALHDVIGKTITYNDSLHLTVAGIVKDWTENSDFRRTEFLSYSTIENSFLRNEIQLNNWGWMMHSSQAFVKLKAESNTTEAIEQFNKIVAKHTKENPAFRLQEMGSIHLDLEDGGKSPMLSTLHALTGLAGFILIIASINFINLSTAQSIKRSREIGIRKVMGSLKLQIVFQFLSETIVLAFISLCLSLALVRPLLFIFSSHLPAGVNFDPMSLNNWLFIGGLLLLISLLAGTYPALVLSSYRPAVTLSGKRISAGSERWSLRKLLIVFQFSVSLFFIIATLVISKQMEFIRSADRGFSTTSVITFRTNFKDKVDKVETLTERLRPLQGITGITMQGFSPMGFAQSRSTFEYIGKQGKVHEMTGIKSGNHDYIPFYKIRIIAGRNIEPSDTVREVVINETLSKKLGFTDPEKVIGEHILMNNMLLSICGVVKDFHQESFRAAMIPCLIANFRSDQHEIAIRLEDPNVLANAGLIAKIEQEFKNVYPDESFSYHFIEDEIGWMHGEEQKTANLAAIAMAVTIFISCMGVFGLAMFTAAMRTREIGIRKVLGATTTSIVNMLSREFMLLILVAVIIASPVAWYYMNDWLLGFTYHVPLNWWIFIAAAGIAMITGLVTVSIQSFKAASANPANALRTD